MNISFKLYETKKQSKVIVRCYKKDLDISQALELYVGPDCWNLESQLFSNSPILNEKLLELKKTILSEYNNSYVTGQIINKAWLQSVIYNVFNRPTGEQNLINTEANIYLSDFANEWLKSEGKTWKVSHNKIIGKTLLGQYQNSMDLLVEFEKFTNRKIVMKDISVDDFYEFINFLQEECNYNVSTIERIIGRIKFFCNRASEKGIKISNAYNKRIYLDKDNGEIDAIYLNEEEIDKIYNLQIEDDNLDNARDLLIIACFSGIRVSDLMHSLDTSKIKDGIISIKTQKTGAFVKIPVHKYVKSILDKRFGNLPRKFSDYEYNNLLKVIGEKSGICQVTYGKLWDNNKKRKVLGYRPKFMYFSSHIGRRSMATNLSGKVSNDVIQSVAGWSSKAMLEKYNSTSKTEYANQLNSYWNENKSINN